MARFPSIIFMTAPPRRRLYGEVLDGRWMHVGTPEGVHAAQEVLASGLSIERASGGCDIMANARFFQPAPIYHRARTAFSKHAGRNAD